MMAIDESEGKPAAADEELVRRSLAADGAAFSLLYDRYARLVRAICYQRVGRLNDAQDVSQEVFLRAYQKLGGLRKPAKFGSWVIGISRTVCKEWHRKHARDRLRFGESDAVESVATDAPGGETQLDELRRAMSALSDSERMALHIHYLQQQPVETARSLFGLSRSGYYRLLSRARDRLGRLLGNMRRYDHEPE
jgi:RNA polymerase sigma-70 factor (ECF subfamily)